MGKIHKQLLCSLALTTVYARPKIWNIGRLRIGENGPDTGRRRGLARSLVERDVHSMKLSQQFVGRLS